MIERKLKLQNFQSITNSFWPNELSVEKYGQIGDYIGGTWGTIISAITLFVVYLTWKSTRRNSQIQSATTILAEMLKTHDAITESGEFSFWDRRGTPSLFLREFSTIYKKTRKMVPSDTVWPISARIDIAYTFAFYGLSFQTSHALSQYGDHDVKSVHDALSLIRNKSLVKNKGMFKGHQATLSHYLRNLFGMYNFIDNSNISIDEKIKFSKIIRTKLSNYDQALLALNVISHLGRQWEAEGFINKYKPFSNIPEYFFGFDDKFNMKERFPMVQFEWEQSKLDRPTVRKINIKRWTILIESRPTEKKLNG